MADVEGIVSDLVAALWSVDRMLAERAAELGSEVGWSEVTSELEVSEWQTANGSANRLGFSGYVDGERAGLGGVGWSFEVIRDGAGWTVERALSLNANTMRYQEPVTELPTARYPGTTELARKLPDLVRELLRLAAPEPPSSA